MIRLILTRLLYGLIFFGIGALLITQLTKSPEVLNDVMSVEDEKRLGDEIYQKQIVAGQNGTLLTDPYLDSVLQLIMKRITDEIPGTQYDYSIGIIASPEVNAFTIPGGHIFFYSAMFKELENPEECAAIISHEAGHNENRDVVRRLVQNYGMTVLTAADPTLLNRIANGLGQLNFERSQEAEADEFGYATMVRAGIHPKYFAEVMGAFEKLESENGEAPPEILSTHPSSERRMNEAINYQVPPDFEEIPFDIDWKEFMEHLEALEKQVLSDSTQSSSSSY